MEKIEKYWLHFRSLLSCSTRTFPWHQYEEESQAWARLSNQAARCWDSSWRNPGCGEGQRGRQTTPRCDVGEQKEMSLMGAAASVRKTSIQISLTTNGALPWSRTGRSGAADKATSQRGSAGLGTTAFPPEGGRLGCPSARVARLSQHGSDWFEGVLFVSQKETAAAVWANQPPFPIQITSYPVLASRKHDFVCLGAATLKCNSQSTGKLICENFRRSTSSHGLMDNTDHIQYKHTELYCLRALRAW